MTDDIVFAQHLVGRAKVHWYGGCSKYGWQRTTSASQHVHLADCVRAEVFHGLQSQFAGGVYLQLLVCFVLHLLKYSVLHQNSRSLVVERVVEKIF